MMLAAFSLASCSSDDDYKFDASKLEVTDNTITNNANYIINADYTVEGINYFKDSFQIPYINFDTPDAKAANEEITRVNLDDETKNGYRNPYHPKIFHHVVVCLMLYLVCLLYV